MDKPLNTCLVGYGRIAASLMDDKAMTAALGDMHTHYDCLFEHPGFHMRGIVERDWESWDQGWDRENCDCVVITTPAGTRLQILETFPNVTHALIEKPLGMEAEELQKYCEAKGIRAYVNYWRRTDELISGLAKGGLRDHIGEPQKSIAIYTRELHHLVNLAQYLKVDPVYVEIEGHPYREVMLDIWGTSGRITFSQELQVVTVYPKAPCRSLDNGTEISSDDGLVLDSTLKTAMYRMYDNISHDLMLGVLSDSILTEIRVREVENINGT